MVCSSNCGRALSVYAEAFGVVLPSHLGVFCCECRAWRFSHGCGLVVFLAAVLSYHVDTEQLAHSWLMAGNSCLSNMHVMLFVH